MSTRTEIPKVAAEILAALELPNEPTLAIEVAAVLVLFHQRITAEWASGLCSKHQSPEPTCSICNSNG